MKNIYDVIIIGGGPAGLTAGIYSARYGMKTLVVEKYYCGGQMVVTTEIKNFPSYENVTGMELSEKMKNHYKTYNGELLQGEVDSIDFDKNKLTISNKTYEYKTLIIAMGAVARKLGLANEKELTGHGVSYCAICDGFFFKGKDIVVAGSGNSALEDSIYLSDLAKSVTIVSKHDNFQGQDILIDKLKSKSNVKYYMGYQPSKLIGEKVLQGVEIKSNDNKDVKTIDAEGLFIQIGRRPDISIIKDKIDCSLAGFVKSNENMNTNIPNVFVAGDIREKSVRQIITACSDGAIAASSAHKYINDLEQL